MRDIFQPKHVEAIIVFYHNLYSKIKGFLKQCNVFCKTQVLSKLSPPSQFVSPGENNSTELLLVMSKTVEEAHHIGISDYLPHAESPFQAPLFLVLCTWTSFLNSDHRLSIEFNLKIEMVL